MNARALFRMSVVAVLLSPVWVAAQIYTFNPLPDLAPVDISLGGDCRIMVTLTNNGPAMMPSSAYVGPATGIQMYKDGAPWGGNALQGVDPAKALQPPGGSVNYLWFGGAVTPNLLVTPGQHTIRVEVDNNNIVLESNEANNNLTKPLRAGSRG